MSDESCHELRSGTAPYSEVRNVSRLHADVVSYTPVLNLTLWLTLNEAYDKAKHHKICV